MRKNVLVDTCFWFGFYNTDDAQHHEDCLLLYEYLFPHKLIIPWPSLYETLNTKFVKQRKWLSQFEDFLCKSNIEKIDDVPYRSAAYAAVFKENVKDRNLSFVDCVLREIMKDINININSILTFNKKDFVDLCHKRRIEFFNG